MARNEPIHLIVIYFMCAQQLTKKWMKGEFNMKKIEFVESEKISLNAWWDTAIAVSVGIGIGVALT